ncbi:hypothetical protein O1M63_15735 [Streptomyces mirabilis]|nr:hypothetical protein [Streptomyces mirabilis]
MTSALALPNGLASPVAPVHAGGGGTAHFASVDARSSSPGTKHAVIGLVLASAAAVAVAVRSAPGPRHPRLTCPTTCPHTGVPPAPAGC